MLDSEPHIEGLEAIPDPRERGNVEYNPPDETLRAASTHLETTTSFGAPAYVSDSRSRSADATRNAVDWDFREADWQVLREGIEAIQTDNREFFCVDRQVGRHPEESYHCRLFVPREYGRIALAWARLLEPVDVTDPDGADVTDTDDMDGIDPDAAGVSDTDAAEDTAPDFVTIQLPDHEETAIRILPDEGLTVVLGSDYTGEAKKSFLRLFMYRAKQAGGLGLHAGSKQVELEQAGAEGGTTTVGQLFLGLSGTGKSTLTGHGFWLEDPESAVMVQDDVCALRTDGVVAGSEGKGLYIKTIGLSRDEQPELYEAATDESAVLENVDVAEDGAVDFDSARHTSNSRAVIQRSRLENADQDIDLQTIDQVFFITRNPLMPPIARLDEAQAAAAFMLGESIQTSAGDPDAAGESIRVVGTNPFIIGSEGEEGNRFQDLIADLDIDTYLINTGTIGAGAKDIQVEDTVRLLTAVARGSIDWKTDESLGMTVPDHVPGLDVTAFDVPTLVEDFESKHEALRADRRAYLAGFEALRQEIVDAAY